jgi:hypothetical protein
MVPGIIPYERVTSRAGGREAGIISNEGVVDAAGE